MSINDIKYYIKNVQRKQKNIRLDNSSFIYFSMGSKFMWMGLA